MTQKRHVTSIEVDEKTAVIVSELAEAWGVSEAEALRRAIDLASSGNGSAIENRLDTFRSLQQSMALTPARAEEWRQSVRDSRR